MPGKNKFKTPNPNSKKDVTKAALPPQLSPPSNQTGRSSKRVGFAMDESTEDPSARRRKASKQSWTDGDEAPQFATPPLPTTSMPPPPVPLSAPTVPSPTEAPVLSPALAHLTGKYDFKAMRIVSSSKIEEKATRLLDELWNDFDLLSRACKPAIVALSAKERSNQKLISVIEIAKRALTERGLRCFQYNRLLPKVVELKEKELNTTELARKPKGVTPAEWAAQRAQQARTGTRPDVAMGDDDEEEEEAFETLGATHRTSQTSAADARTKIRAVPVLTIYMSRVPVRDLKDEYG
ncbi:hypothetical protein B0A49_10199 [Cryomyces minteri]|uniref:DNA/RNA-binding protein Alba-like domain-containing protein n=1 Tax=Cryomyces minteri TaxID=331657 RepID=A0A4U0WVW3_9PEZI|nr:hypothetical protein B0A49_10199 [Cryomyces minteri]